MTQRNEEIIEAAIQGFEARKQQIDEVISELRQRIDGGTSAPTPSTQPAGRRKMSTAARKRIAEAQRRRWAAMKKASGQQTAAPAKKAKRHLSPEGRRRIIEATKKRWAAIRAAQKKAAK